MAAFRKHRYLALLLPLMLLSAGCAGLPQTRARPVQASVPSPTPLNTLNNQPPIPTAAVFELKPTFTPLPTETRFAMDTLQTERGYGPKNFPDGVNPLTGLVVKDPALLERRPMVIKVTNFPRQVRPQWGLTLADHVYEYYLEDGMTRFVGIFYSQDAERVGPIRSARPFDEHLVRMYKGIFVFGYADRKVYDPLVESDLSRFLVITRPGNCPPMCRIGPDWDYNTLYTNTTELTQYINERGVDNIRQDLSGLNFWENGSSGGGEANNIYIRFSRTSYHAWQYEAGSRRYLRSQEVESRDPGEETYDPLYDSLTGNRIKADNLIVLMVPSSQFFESNSTDIYNYNLIGTGKAYGIREGRIFKLIWSRPTPESLITLRFANGRIYPLKPGNIWYEVLTTASTHEVEAGGVWRFTFDLGLE